ncbi:MAG TPA: DUF485 domain-containing protein [Cytophagaceae bacterium]|jgi:uncharacterized membrane protein (DUF485 family)|nr:DUF485 domain-containing protein [Cytophagaceae bacterium]
MNSKIIDTPAFKVFVKKRWRVSLLLTFIMLFIYFGFILTIAFHKDWLAYKIGSHISIGLPIGVGIIISAWLLTGIYVSWANSVYDKKVEELKSIHFSDDTSNK